MAGPDGLAKRKEAPEPLASFARLPLLLQPELLLSRELHYSQSR